MFEFIKNGQNLIDNRIQWKFADREEVFRSEEARLERNVAFFRKKYKIGPDVEVILLNVKKVEENVEPITIEPHVESIDIVNDNIVTEEPSLPQVAKNSVNPTKRKSRAKTPKL